MLPVAGDMIVVMLDAQVAVVINLCFRAGRRAERALVRGQFHRHKRLVTSGE
jgi:hypothetical protein